MPRNILIPLEGILMVLMSIMISNIFKVDWNFPNYEERFPLSFLMVVDPHVSPLQCKKTKLHTIYAVHFTTCTLTGKERKVSGLRRKM